ncbi:MAG TPA: PAS domain-containing sensor histidine kinase, partial [Anaerolineales bacterium]
LADAATGFRQGNLGSPVSVDSSVWEINQLANTLEDARIALQHSLRQLQARTAWNEQLLNSIVEGIVTLDNQDRITFASEGLARTLDDDPAHVLGRRIDEVFLPAEGETPFSSQLPEAGQQRRVSIRLKNGQPRLLSISKARFVPPEAENANRALVIRDVSQDEYLHRLLGDFLANITHEFRTPLAALEASSELMLDHLQTLSREEMEELLVSLNLGIIDLQTLIDNLIEAASIEAGRFKVSVSPVPFEGILNDALGIIQPLAKKYALTLEASPADPALRLLADHRRTVQALVNLLSNAVKHSPETGVIRIGHEVKGKMLCVEVSDEGSGFTEGQQGQLFRHFSHLDTSHERARHGAGLGLSVVKAIVEAQQGEVGIRDTQGHGASIWFTVPLAEEVEA